MRPVRPDGAPPYKGKALHDAMSAGPGLNLGGTADSIVRPKRLFAWDDFLMGRIYT